MRQTKKMTYFAKYLRVPFLRCVSKVTEVKIAARHCTLAGYVVGRAPATELVTRRRNTYGIV